MLRPTDKNNVDNTFRCTIPPLVLGRAFISFAVGSCQRSSFLTRKSQSPTQIQVQTRSRVKQSLFRMSGRHCYTSPANPRFTSAFFALVVTNYLLIGSCPSPE